ncbi:hypothetical protein ECC02_005388 [Trypanosoma cruzi]|uniref:Uncharacterized protein n=1 Tax=Trypanosoma cruzi TaxID=5693 RepID=A0A7J6Y439_TRYCR|nr:hypothetical protein ECC02_010514 [Trypanosoma cruzi]KAF5221501.1 hypothetical protein ECC02_005388 [Trypanosoma cruzi]
MTTALCASPAARMRRGRDERRAEGAVTCGRATRAGGAEHTFLSLFSCGQGGQTPAAPHTHTATPCRRVSFVLFLFYFIFCGCVLPPCVIVEVGAVPHVSLPSSCASCRPDVPHCAPSFFSVSPAHTQTRKYLHSGLHECSWRQWGVGLRPVLKWQHGCTMPAVCEGVACSCGHSLLVVFAFPWLGVARCVLTRDGRCHDGLL